jgi:hypothetical protein
VRLESRDSINESDVATVELDPVEARALRAALGEVCFGFTIPDFSKRIGGSEEDAQRLFARFDPLGDQSAIIALTKSEMHLLKNAHAATLNELGNEEYFTRTGVEFSSGQAILTALDAVLSTGT